MPIDRTAPDDPDKFAGGTASQGTRLSGGQVPAFEDAYRRHAFAPLVSMAIAAAGWLVQRRQSKPSRWPASRAKDAGTRDLEKG